MKLRDGYYIISAPDYHTTEETAMEFLQFLSADIDATQPQVQWSFHPKRSNMSVFFGVGLHGGANHVVLEKIAIKGGFQVILNFYEGTKPQYTMVDLCREPQSELLDLYARVSRAVHDAMWKRSKTTIEQTPHHQMNGSMPSNIYTIGEFLHEHTRA